MEDRLFIKLYQLRRRQAWVAALQSGMRGGLWGGWLSVGAMGGLALLGLPVETQLEGLLVWPVVTAAGFLRGLLHPMSLRQVAHRADTAHGLQERLLTCYGNLESQRSGGAVSRLLLEDTLQHLDKVDPRATFPNRWQRPLLRWTVPLLCALAMVTVQPFARADADPQQQEVLASRQRLSRLAERLQAARPRSGRNQELQKLLRQMPNQVPRQAARQIRRELQQVQRQLARQASQAQQMESMLQNVEGQGAQTAAERQKQQQALTRQVDDLRRQLEAQHSAEPHLQNAREALRSAQPDQARKALEQALEQLARGEEAQEAQQISQALQDELQQLAPQSGLAQDDEGAGAGPMQLAQGEPGDKKGKGQADFGQGSTNQATGDGKNAKTKQRSQRQSQQQRHKQEEYERLYGPERQHMGMRRERALLSGAKGKLLLMPEGQLGAARQGDPSLRAQQDEFLAAKALAEQSVAEERIPAEHRDAVRRYFDQIDPR